MRDGISWIYAEKMRARLVFGAGLAIGLTVLLFGIFLY
jgi:hypothetical protein